MARYRKGILAVLAAVGVVASSGLLHGAVQDWVSVIIAAAGAALVVLVPNAGVSTTTTTVEPAD